MKKKMFDKLLETTAKVIDRVARTSAGLASFGGAYQPKEPKGLKK